MSNQITPNPSVPSQVVQEVKFPKFVNNLGIIPTSYKDSMDYYENLAWLCKYLEETVIPTINENGEAVEELQGLYIELNSYVTHYFDNLDVQEEINNKLDDMVESGELQTLLSEQYSDLRNEVNEEITEVKNDQQILSDRMDEFTSLPSGSTSGDAELIDIRVGSDSKTYDSAGSSVRGQVGNIFKPIYRDDTLLNTNGVTNTNDGWTTLINYIPVECLLTISVKSYTNVGTISYYNEKLQFISCQNGDNITIENAIIPNNAKYFRVCYFNTDRSIFNIQFNNILNSLFEKFHENYQNMKNASENDIYDISSSSTSNPVAFHQFNITKNITSGTKIVYGVLNLENINVSQPNKNIILYGRRAESSPAVFDILGTIEQNTGVIETITEHNYDYFRVFVNVDTPASQTAKALIILSEKKADTLIYDILKINALNSYNYYNKLNNKIGELTPNIKKRIILDASGNGDFTTFESAVDYCNANANTYLFIRKGNYNITNFTNKYISFDILANEGAKIIANYTGSDSDIIQNYSPINIARVSNNEVTIDGLTIEVTNCRYCIHDEMGGGN